MSLDKHKSRMIFNMKSNYGMLVIKIILMILLLRILFTALSNQDYGYWALLWTIFGYSLLLDFGFGTAVIKDTSQALELGKWDRYNYRISTIFFTYVGLSFVIIIATVALAFNIETIFVFEENSDIEYYKNVLLIFGIGSAIFFPFGFFGEILHGLHELHLRNKLSSIQLILNFIFMTIAVEYGYGLYGMITATFLVFIGYNFSLVYYSYKLIPNLSIKFKYFDKNEMRSIVNFSMLAYIITFSNVIIHKTDQIVVSVMGSMALVALYQIAIRLSDMYRQFSTQFLSTLGPVASALFATKKNDDLSKVLLLSNRLIGFISSLLLIPLVLYIDEILKIWLDLHDPTTSNIAIVLMVSIFIMVFFRSSSVQVLLMCNKEKELAIIATIEALANLVLSIYLIKDYSLMGVAIGTLIPNFILAFIYNIPVACKFANIKIYEYIKTTILPTLIPLFIALLGSFYIKSILDTSSIVQLLMGLISTIFIFILIYLLIGLNKEEKEKLAKKLNIKI